MTRYIFAGQFTVGGSGYTYIIKNIAYSLVDRGHEVMILALEYRGQPHNFPFHVVPMKHEWLMEALRVIPTEWKADRVIVARDIPKLCIIANWYIEKDQKEKLWGFEALYPVESEPILPEWIDRLGNFKTRYVISKYGTDLCNKTGIPSHRLMIGCSVGNRPKDKSVVRDILGWPRDKVIFLTVAENHDRKGLPIGIEAFSHIDNSSAEYRILTNPTQSIGWDLDDIKMRYGVADRVHIMKSGVSQPMLSMMYWAADALVVPSQAEGACMPIYEAAAHGLPVICGTWTGMSDFTNDSHNWIIPIGAEYVFDHPWGNTKRWFASKEELCNSMNSIVLLLGSKQYADMSSEAIEFAKSCTWNKSVDLIEGVNSVEKSI